MYNGGSAVDNRACWGIAQNPEIEGNLLCLRASYHSLSTTEAVRCEHQKAPSPHPLTTPFPKAGGHAVQCRAFLQPIALPYLSPCLLSHHLPPYPTDDDTGRRPLFTMLGGGVGIGGRKKKRNNPPLNGGLVWGKTILTTSSSSSTASSSGSSPQAPITTRKHSSLLYLTVKPDYLVLRAPCGAHSTVRHGQLLV